MSRRRHGKVITAAVAAPLVAGLVLASFVVASCGEDGDNTVKRKDASGDSTIEASADGAADATAEATPGFDATPPDGGPAPIVPCGDAGDAGVDAAGECSLPPSVCIDDHWLRYYAGTLACTEAGVCDIKAYDMLCAQSQTPPDCYQGGCRLVIVR